MKQENKEKIAQAEEILERLKEQRGGNVVSITPFWGDRVLINHLMQVAERRRVKYETGR